MTMVQPLVLIHATLGEFAIFAFIWAFVELLGSTKQGIGRAKIAAVVGTIMIFASWLAGGFYYVTFYGGNVKPVILGSTAPWAHSVFMEAKEHIFLFLPFLSLLATNMIYNYQKVLDRDKKARMAVLLICGLIVLISLSMVLMGSLISAGARTGLEAKVG